MHSDLRLLLDAYAAGEVPLFPADLQHACAQARARPKNWRDHPPVLALSIGGSNSSAMLAQNRGGTLEVLRAVRRPNPVESVPLEDYLDDMLLTVPEFQDYLSDNPAPQIGVAIAVAFDRGTPFHPSKIATIQGLVARDLEQERQACHFPTNFNAWLTSRGFEPGDLYFEGDAPVAHLGGLAGCDPAETGQSLLLVCGTGLACADDRYFILPSLLKVLCELDPQLFPPEICEQGQFQYLAAGKGVWAIYRRALELRLQQVPDLASAPPTPADWLAGPADSRKVYQLWAFAEGKETLSEELEQIRELYPEAVWEEVLATARKVGARAIGALAATLVSTMAHQQLDPGEPLIVFVEGSIARNPTVLQAVRQAVDEQSREVAEEAGVRLPDIRWVLDPHVPPTGDPAQLQAVDQTLHGAAAMVFAGHPRGTG